jgi:hypothetical protein
MGPEVIPSPLEKPLRFHLAGTIFFLAAQDFLVTSVMNIDASFGQIVPIIVQTTQEEYENFIGCRIPEQVEIHPPTDVRSKGRSKRIKKAKELPKSRKRKNDNNVKNSFSLVGYILLCVALLFGYIMSS